ncbi:MAG: hypothetical protein IT191_01165 [Microbacteriaceae bacterium]|nr:hypothetical protein [Microbacteriaceae bacterium]
MNSGHPRPGYFFVDAIHRLRSPLVPTVVAVFVAFAGTLSIFATTGVAIASQQRTIDLINSAEGRLITISDPQGDAGLSERSITAIKSISGVDWVLGVSPAHDFVNSALPGGTSVPVRNFFGDLPAPISTGHPGVLGPGQALAGPGVARKLGLADGVGAIENRTEKAVIVGSFSASSPLTSLNSGVIMRPNSDTGARLLRLWVSVEDVAQLQPVAAAVSKALVVEKPGGIQTKLSPDLARLSGDVVTGLRQDAALTITGLLFAVAVLIGALQFGRVASTAKDIGRRRALGASRSVIVAQVLINAGLTGLIGAIAGVLVGLVLSVVIAGQLPGFGFSAAVAVLMVLASLIGAIAPAIRAARLDPVRILRVP